ncbi:hypothetical protein FB446DRAFT_796019 [Lentinula raphanica]|uniref:Uncharacterized protein n=1 Tax=Lentinula raphanica TaxID=153919 RepID=A0AA38NUP2_9AGAR|nr:hypothetical protein FB446DRAFT_796019 [Lentinula raphanica]KAJ3821367.1 hypothetical protein F5880DRAFT_1614741 [Lentinula raphanica]KAJ3830944.1 hypothetical protein F5878DRAFT_668133 [Lentinula raphanica]
MSLSSRLKTVLNNIKPTANSTTCLMALQELIEAFVRELIKILGGRSADRDENDDDDGDEEE